MKRVVETKTPRIPRSVQQLLSDPPAGSKTRAAIDFGIDLSLTVRNVYALSPTQRIERAEQAMRSLHEFRTHLKRS